MAAARVKMPTTAGRIIRSRFNSPIKISEKRKQQFLLRGRWKDRDKEEEEEGEALWLLPPPLQKERERTAQWCVCTHRRGFLVKNGSSFGGKRERGKPFWKKNTNGDGGRPGTTFAGGHRLWKRRGETGWGKIGKKLALTFTLTKGAHSFY